MKDVHIHHSFHHTHWSTLVSIHCLSRRIRHGRIDVRGSDAHWTKPSCLLGRMRESQFPSIQDEIRSASRDANCWVHVAFPLPEAILVDDRRTIFAFRSSPSVCWDGSHFEKIPIPQDPHGPDQDSLLEAIPKLSIIDRERFFELESFGPQRTSSHRRIVLYETYHQQAFPVRTCLVHPSLSYVLSL